MKEKINLGFIGISSKENLGCDITSCYGGCDFCDIDCVCDVHIPTDDTK